LLFAFAAAGASGVSIRVRDLKSRPYIDLTLEVMRHFGWKVENREYEEFYFSGVWETGKPEYTVEGDWSGGAFLLVAGAIAGPITVRGLDEWSTQADKAILGALCDCGAGVEMTEDGIRVGAVADPVDGGAGPRALKAFQFDATDCPDLFPPLVALAAYCSGTTVIRGVSRLAHKESDRGLTLQEEFGKMGVPVELHGDRMLVYGGGVVKGATVHSRHDHRIAMACAVVALKAVGPVTIEESDAINKSYPDFYIHLQQLGAQVNMPV
jgi:3-phosphoshikimate 1-carboxyvinyltransferase